MRKRGYQTIALLMGLTMLTACSRSEGKPPRADLEIRPLVLEYCETCTKAVWPNTDDYKVSVGPPLVRASDIRSIHAYSAEQPTLDINLKPEVAQAVTARAATGVGKQYVYFASGKILDQPFHLVSPEGRGWQVLFHHDEELAAMYSALTVPETAHGAP